MQEFRIKLSGLESPLILRAGGPISAATPDRPDAVAASAPVDGFARDLRPIWEDEADVSE